MEEKNNELLDYVKEIRDLNKKRVFWERIEVFLLAVFVVAVLSLVPLIIKTLNTATEAMESATETLEMAGKTIGKADSIMDDLGGTIASMETAIDSVTALVDDSSDKIVTAFDNINSIDFEGLNDAITDLGNVVEPLSNFFGKFKY